MTVPDSINARWIATLADAQVLEAEAELHGIFRAQEVIEKAKTGARYRLLEGSTLLVTAWHRWLTFNNEARYRGLQVGQRPRSH